MKDNTKKVIREFALTTAAIGNRTTVIVLTCIVFLLGLISYINMPKAAFPEVSMPTIYIGTTYPGNSPLDMENLITRPIEKELNTITGVDEIKSTSIQDYSTIIVQFESDIIVENALQDVKDAVDKVKKDLPSDLEQDPNIFELNFAEFPVMNINLSGDFSLDELNDYAEYLEDEFEELREISKVEIRGVQGREVKIHVDLHKMESLNMKFGDIEKAIANENRTISGGNIITNGIRRTVRVVGEFKSPKEIEGIIVKHEKQRIVYLRDIGTVNFDYEEAKSYARQELAPVVMLDVIKRSGANLLDASDKINAIIEEAKKDVFPANLQLSITNDQSDMTRSQVANLENSIISGVILVVMVLLFFLGLRNALFVGMAIPLSMFISFMILSGIGFSINMVVLFGLIMALGMLVDNGIVVVENIYRYMDEGHPPLTAAKEAVGEVAWPIISSTATTLAAFVPLAFWPGMMGEFMVYLPVTLIIVLGSSLFVALVINPVATALFMKIDKGDSKVSKKTIRIHLIICGVGLAFVLMKMMVFGNILLFYGLFALFNIYFLTPASKRFQNGFLPWLERKYESTLTFALRGRNSLMVFLGTFALLAASVMLMIIFTPKVIFFPDNEPKYLNVFIEFPLGTDIEVVNSFTKKIEQKVENFLTPYKHIVESTIAQVGEGTSDPNDPNSQGGGATPHKARIQVNFVEMEFRVDDEGNEILSSDIMNELRDKIGRYPGVFIAVDKDQAGPPAGKPINIEVTGLEYEQIIAVSEDLKKLIQVSEIEGIENLKSDMELGKPELIFEIDRDKARRLGLSSAQIAFDLRNAIFGKEISKYKEGEDDYPIMLRLQDKYRYDKDALLHKHIIYRDQTSGKIRKIPVSSVATLKLSSSYGSVRRKNLDRVITLFSNVIDGYNATEVNDQIKELIKNEFSVPQGVDVRFTGEQEKQQEEMAFLSTALLLAVFMIFLIIVAQFNKVSAPVIILFSVILSTIGVFIGLVVFQMDFIIIMTMIGIISLAGIVVNNAIVLLDYIDLTKKRHAKRKSESSTLDMKEIRAAIVQAGKTRLRPVLLTAITTVLGLIPLAIGLNIDFFGLFKSYEPNVWLGGDNVIFWGPMSWTIIFGITFATFLTLVFVPVMYLLIDKLKIAVGLQAT
ncbi:MAG: copper transporter [Bacteroidetes bacterium]|nr:MAG: copper transporter [Bacteroidota bacterium]